MNRSPAGQWSRLPVRRGANTLPIAEQTLPSIPLLSRPWSVFEKKQRMAKRRCMVAEGRNPGNSHGSKQSRTCGWEAPRCARYSRDVFRGSPRPAASAFQQPKEAFIL